MLLYVVMMRRTLFLLALASLVGCAAESAEVSTDEGGGADAPPGDSATAEDDLASERQLNGSELADKTISLTFDDGPGPRTAELANFLADQGIPAAFFINGMQVPGRQGALDTIVGRGHVLANHTQNHKQLTSLGAASIQREVRETDDIIAAVQPNGPWFLRAPFGAWKGSTAQAVNDSAMKKYVGSIFWDEGGALTDNAAADWACWGNAGLSVDKCASLYLKEIETKRRGIVLMHDIHNKTVDMVKVLVPQLVAKGYRFAKLEDVPAVSRAMGSASATGNQCQSATLGRPVDENVCVQSKSTGKWSRCVGGEWLGSTGPGDTRCTQHFPL